MLRLVHLTFFVLLIAIGGCSNAPETRITHDAASPSEHSGVIVGKQNGRVLLVKSADREDILQGRTTKIIAEPDNEAIWVKIPQNDYARLQKGDIIEFHNANMSVVDFSMPAQTEASRVELLAPAAWTDDELAQLESFE